MTVPKADDNIENLPDVFFYVFIDGKRVAFQRVPARDFQTKRKFAALKLLPDIYNKSSSVLYKGGLLKFSMRIYDNSDDRPPSDAPQEKPKIKRGFQRITAEGN